MRLVLGVLVDTLGALDQILGPAGRDEIGLLEEIEDRVLRPFGVLEPLVLGLRLGHGIGVFALSPPQSGGPEVQELRAEPGLRLDDPLRIDHPRFGHLAEGLHGFARPRRRNSDLAAPPSRA